MSGENPADLVAAITSALSNQERDSTDHLGSGSASTGSMSSLVVSCPLTDDHIQTWISTGWQEWLQAQDVQNRAVT